MATVSEQIQEIYIGLLGRAADKTGLAYWVDQITSGNLTIEQLRANIVNEQAEYQAGLGSMTRTQVVTELYNRLFERAPEADGLEYWVNGDGASVNVDQLVLALSNGAGTDDRAVLNNKVEAAEYYTANVAAASDTDAAAEAAVADVDGTAASVTASKAATDALSGGQGFNLTSGTDNLTGTSGADEFSAYLQQNANSGGVSNSLSSADRIDGGAGTDTLNASLVPEFFGSTGDLSNQIDVQPVTSNVENVMVEVRDIANGATGGNGTVTLDAKNMTEVKKIGSSFSDGDLVIENLTTQNNGAIDLTSTMTVVMSHTDNFNSDTDASDLTVYFDEDYLNTTSTNSGSTLLIRLVNAVTNVDNGNPIFGTDSFTVMVGTTTVTVDVSAIAADASLDYTTAYDQVVTAINGAMANAGFPNVTAAKSTLSPTVFSIPVTVDGTDYDVGDSAGSYFPILVTNSGSEELGQGSFQQATVNTDTDINSSMTPTPTSEQEVPISINIDLEKVGRDGDGGNLVIGGKDTTSSDTDVDQNDGIEIFNIDVLGDSDKPSNLGYITSTNAALKTVNIETASEFVSGDTHAALTVRGQSNHNTATSPFGGTLDTLNANAFLGDLYIGRDGAGRAESIETFTATGGGDVTYWAEYGQTVLSSTGNLAYSTTTAGGSDTINADIDGGAQVTVTTGAGDDKVTASVNGETDSTSTQSKIIVNATGGNNTVTLSSTNVDVNKADVTTGAGADEVTGGGTHLTVDTNAGNDVIYAENTGTKTVAVLDNLNSVWDTTSTLTNGHNIAHSALLNGRTLAVTVAMPEDAASIPADRFVDGYEVTTTINASNGVLTTERDLYQAAADAINGDAVLKELVKAELDSNGNLIVTYLVDGTSALGDQMVELDIVDDNWTDRTTEDKNAVLAAVRDQFNDSAITEATVEAAYNAADTTADHVLAGGEASVFNFDVSGLTTDAGDVITFTIGANTGTVTETGADGAGTFDDAGANAAADLAGATVVIGGVTYTISDAGGNTVDLTATSGVGPLDSSVADDQGTPNTAAGTQTAGTSAAGVLGTNSTTNGVNKVNAGTGDDVVVLSSNDAFDDTIVFDAGGFGTDTIVHFNSAAGGDMLDFTAWLDNTVSNSGSAVSADRVATTVVAGTAMAENSVHVTDFTTFNGIATATLTFDALTGAQVLTALNQAGGYASAAGNAQLVETSQKSIIMIENNANRGEYKVFEVTSETAAATDNFTAVTLVGTADFGDQFDGTFDATNLV